MRHTVSSWFRWLITEPPRPSYIPLRADDARRCPECHTSYGIVDRYCPDCHTAVPEWRFG